MAWSVQPSGKNWNVEENGVTRSTHRKKRRAIAEARRLAPSGASLRIHGRNGMIQKNLTVR